MNAADENRIDPFARALDRLNEALDIPIDAPLAIDGSIRRFEFTFELAWKAVKRALAAEGVDAATPREVLKAAFAAGWLDDEDGWLSMLKDRNLTSHTYREDLAQAIRARLPTHRDALAALLSVLTRRES